MKKKLFASLLVGSAVVGANLVPLSAQAVTTGNTPVQVEFDGGKLADQGDNTGAIVDPDPTKPNTNFDLLAIPKIFDFSPVKIGELSQNRSWWVMFAEPKKVGMSLAK